MQKRQYSCITSLNNQERTSRAYHLYTSLVPSPPSTECGHLDNWLNELGGTVLGGLCMHKTDWLLIYLLAQMYIVRSTEYGHGHSMGFSAGQLQMIFAPRQADQFTQDRCIECRARIHLCLQSIPNCGTGTLCIHISKILILAFGAL